MNCDINDYCYVCKAKEFYPTYTQFSNCMQECFPFAPKPHRDEYAKCLATFLIHFGWARRHTTIKDFRQRCRQSTRDFHIGIIGEDDLAFGYFIRDVLHTSFVSYSPVHDVFLSDDKEECRRFFGPDSCGIVSVDILRGLAVVVQSLGTAEHLDIFKASAPTQAVLDSEALLLPLEIFGRAPVSLEAYIEQELFLLYCLKTFQRFQDYSEGASCRCNEFYNRDEYKCYLSNGRAPRQDH
ncbi:MAG: hypothetical protein GY847_32785 [Proteobacteria bacterium]|nr:hypothetical protein [Pseudomonadota bacterium]